MSKDSTLQIIFGGKHWKKETSPYGWRIHPITGKKTFHYGSDFSCTKVPVYAIEDGKVYKRGYDKSAGNYIYVYYSRLGVCVAYFHLTSIALKKGAAVKKGTKVGVAGTTGGSTGVHLHVGVRNKKTWKWTNSDTWLSSYKPYVAVPTKNLKKGDKGEQVKRLQRCLVKIMGSKLAIDGSYGPATVSAIKALQKKYKLKVDGSCGPQTRAKIKALI